MPVTIKINSNITSILLAISWLTCCGEVIPIIIASIASNPLSSKEEEHFSAMARVKINSTISNQPVIKGLRKKTDWINS